MPSTRPSSTKSGASKRAKSKACAPGKSSATSSKTSDQVADVAPAAADEDRSTIAAAGDAGHAPPAIYIPPEVVNQVVEWALAGYSGYTLGQAVEGKFPELPVADVFARVAEHFLQAGNADPVRIRGFAIEGYRELYRKALHIGDLATALKALARLEKAGAG